jgi:hypothetical protein
VIALTYGEVAAPLAAGYWSCSLGNPGSAVGIGPGACYCSGAFAFGRDGSATDTDAVRMRGAARIGLLTSIVSLTQLSMLGAEDSPHDFRLTNGNLTWRRCGSEMLGLKTASNVLADIGGPLAVAERFHGPISLKDGIVASTKR